MALRAGLWPRVGSKHPHAASRDAFPAVPLARLLLALCIGEGPSTVLFAVLPLAFVRASIRPSELAMALLLVIEVVTIVDSAVGPSELAFAHHAVLVPPATGVHP